MRRGSASAINCFNPHPRTGGDRTTARRCGIRGSFNPHPRTGGDRTAAIATLAFHMFQSTPPHGGRREDRRRSMRRRTCFNPHPRTGGDVRRVVRPASVSRFQSIPPHGGRRVQTLHQGTRQRVSIHTPARGATRVHLATVAGAYSFNPHPRTGGDVHVLANTVD